MNKINKYIIIFIYIVINWLAPIADSVGFWIESRSARMFVIAVVHIQCSRLFKGLECAVLSNGLCTMKKLGSHSIKVGHSADFGLPSVVISP